MRALRGYNLVEMMIALVVIGLVIGGALVPLKNWQEQRQVDAAEKHLAAAREAVHAYMLSHVTDVRVVEAGGEAYRFPVGRPYLPCPDVTGDGLEDRTEIADTIAAVTLFVANGGCVAQKGLLPWNTLGLRELDSWGSRLTYRVDEKYSNALVGFDETFRSDVFDLFGRASSTYGPIYDVYATRGRGGAVICDKVVNRATDGGCPSEALDNVVAGVVTEVTLALGHWVANDGAVTVSNRVVPAYDVRAATPTGLVDGAVYVIVSHGKNGFGAIGRGNVCRRAPRAGSGAFDLSEVVNAYYAVGHPFLSTPFDCKMATGFTPVFDLYENQFVSRLSQITRSNLSDGFDDLVVWAGTNELYGYLGRGGAMPIEKLEFLPR